MLYIVTSTFVFAWAGTVVFVALLFWLALRSKSQGAVNPGRLKRWHSIYTWPVTLLSGSTWQEERERNVAKVARISALAAIAAFAILGSFVLYLSY